MKQLLLILFFLCGLISYSQDLPSPYEYGFSFPIGTKFTIRLDTANTKDIKYSITKFEAFDGMPDTYDYASLFDKDGEEGTIDFYFCLSTTGKSEEEKEKNRKVVLVFKNRTKYAFKYVSEIQREDGGEFEETSNIGAYPGAIGNEMWPYMIYAIGIREFTVMK